MNFTIHATNINIYKIIQVLTNKNKYEKKK